MTREAPTITPEAISLELLRITECTAVSVGPLIGSGDKIAIDRAATNAMAGALACSDILSVSVAINEGIKDEAPHLPHDEVIGEGPVRLDLAADVVERTNAVALNHHGGLSLGALAPRGKLLPWLGVAYMNKLVAGPELAERMTINGYINLAQPPEQNIREAAAALRKNTSQLHIAVLERSRNRDIIEAAKRLDVKLELLEAGDVLPAIEACMDDGTVDMLYGSGGAPETVLTAAAVAGFGGNMQAMWDPQTPAEHETVQAIESRGQVFYIRDLLGDQQEVYFSATAITPNRLMPIAVHQDETGAWVPGDSIAVHGTAYPR
jgi:fructose-1,6-bisphosphatase II